MTLIGHDAWLEAPYTDEAEPVTCAGQDTHGIFLVDGSSFRSVIGLDQLAFALTHEDLAEGLRTVLQTIGAAPREGVTECPKKGSVLTEDDFAPGTDCCGTCGGPTRTVNKEELRGE